MSKAMEYLPGQVNAALVAQAKFFSSLSISELNEIAQHFRQEEWEKATLVSSSHLQTRFYILIDGQLEIRQHNPDTGREITLELLYAGDSFDVIVLLDGKAHDVLLVPLTGI